MSIPLRCGGAAVSSKRSEESQLLLVALGNFAVLTPVWLFSIHAPLGSVDEETAFGDTSPPATFTRVANGDRWLSKLVAYFSKLESKFSKAQALSSSGRLLGHYVCRNVACEIPF
jgi:hypothetical protein